MKYTLLDISLRSGKGVHSLIEGVLTVAPELSMFPTFPKAGITYSTLTRTSIPSGHFRKVGEGVGLEKSEWKREVGSMALFEAQMRVPEDIVMAARSENPELVTGDILADEAIATLKGSANRIGSQSWYGVKIDADGFAGLSTQVATATNEVNAGGATNTDTSSVYLLDLDNNSVNPQGVHFLLGNGGRMNFAPTWGTQQIETAAASGKFFNAFTNNFLAYLGLVVARPEAVYRVKNVKAGNAFTDAIGAELLAKVPLALRNNKSRLRWFMNSNAAFLLQSSRQATLVTENGAKMQGTFPAMPTECQGIPIELTDSLVTTERNGLKP